MKNKNVFFNKKIIEYNGWISRNRVSVKIGIIPVFLDKIKIDFSRSIAEISSKILSILIFKNIWSSDKLKNWNYYCMPDYKCE